MMRKLTVLLALILVVSMVAGCASEIPSSSSSSAAASGGSSSGGAQASGSSAEDEEPISLVFWVNDGSTQWMDCWNTVRDNYKAVKPNVTIETVGIPWENATVKFNTAAATNTLPDFGHTASSIATLMLGQNKLVDLTPYFEQYEGKDDIDEGAITEAQNFDPNKEGLWWAPMFTTVHQIWYRTDWLAEAGYTEFPQTWDELFSAIEDTTRDGHYGWSFRGGAGSNSLLNYFILAYTDNTSFFTEDGTSIFRSEKVLEGLTRYVDIFRNGYAPPTSIANGYTEMIAEMTTGNAAMAWHHLQSAPLLLEGGLTDEQIGYGFVPLNENGRRIKVDGGQGIPIFTDSKEENRQAAWDYLTFLWTPEQQKIIATVGGGVPVNLTTDMSDDRFVAAALEQTADENTVNTTLPSYLPNWNQYLNETLEPDLQALMMGDLTPEAALEKWADETEAMYQEYFGS